MALWPPAWANFSWVSLDSHHLQKSTASLVTASLFQVVMMKGWPPMLDQRIILPSAPLRPGIMAKATLSATFEVFGLIDDSAKPTHSRLTATLPSRNSSSVLKMSIVPVLTTGGMYFSSDR